MDKSLSREPGKDSLRPASLISKLGASVLVVAAAGAFVWTLISTNPAQISDPGQQALVTECDPGSPIAAKPCPSLPANQASISDALPLAANTDDRVAHSPSTSAGSDEIGVRAYDLRDGYTLVELCAAGILGEGLHCQPQRYFGQRSADSVFAAAKNSDTAVISGHVFNPEGEGVKGVRIVATPAKELDSGDRSAADSIRYWTVTDSQGRYVFNGLTSGEYFLRTGKHNDYRSARTTARAGVDYADMILARETEVRIEGYVLSSSGEPLEGVTVLPGVLGQRSVLSDDDGYFVLPLEIQPGTDSVSLKFHRPGFHVQNGQVVLAKLDTTTFVTTGFVLHPVETWAALSGIISDEDGDELAGREIELRPMSGQQSYRTTTDRRGRYSFPVLESPADYQLIVMGGDGYKDYQQTLHLTADAGELDVVVDSYDYGSVHGKLVNQSGEPIPEFALVLRNTDSRRPNAMVTTDASGNFSLPEVPAGELVMASQSKPTIHVQGMQLDAGDELSLPLMLDWGEHEIHGTVLDALDNPVPASRVILQWSHEEDGVTTRAIRRTAANTQGQFAFSNLGPGPHHLRIDAPGYGPVDIEHDLNRQGYNLTVRMN